VVAATALPTLANRTAAKQPFMTGLNRIFMVFSALMQKEGVLLNQFDGFNNAHRLSGCCG
jgi:hypothetical protein